MSFFKDINTEISRDGSLRDAFGRFRVSEPRTIFDSKQIADALPLLWDEAETSGSGTGTSFSANRASTSMSVSNLTAGTRVRQTFMRFNYQPGKSQLILMTTVLGASSAGITKQVGQFDSNNGVFFDYQDGVMGVTVRSNVSGSPVDTRVVQSSWNLDKLDGSGKSGYTLDYSKAQIFFTDYEWLGVGKIRFGVVIDGKIIYCHEVNNSNNITSVYMSTPNLPLRYEISNDGTGAADSLECICSSIVSEGGSERTGVLNNVSTDGTHVDANAANTVYACLGIRLKTTHLGISILLEGLSMLSETNDDFEWIVYLNPTVAGTFTYNDKSNSAVQTAKGATANTVTNGTPLFGGFSKQSAPINELAKNAIRLGAAIDGNRDEIVLCVRPLGANSDIQASLNWRELL